MKTTILSRTRLLVKTRLLFFCLALSVPASAGAAGITQHRFMSDIAYDLITTPELSSCLSGWRDAYLMGATFPDTGWAVFDDDLGNDTHSRAFIDAFVEHMLDAHEPPYTSWCRSISFMMGVASHIADDPPYHAYFMAEAAIQDFHGNYDIASIMCDAGLDFVNIVDYDRWDDIPEFWLPLGEIQEVYARMGSSYGSGKIIFGNIVLLVGDYAERLVADLLYRPLTRIMPWTVENYYDYPYGGLFNGGEVAAEYYEETWDKLMNPTARFTRMASRHELERPGGVHLRLEPSSGASAPELRHPLYAFARRCLEENIVEVDVTELEDGNVILGAPRIVNPEAFNILLNELVNTTRPDNSFVLDTHAVAHSE